MDRNDGAVNDGGTDAVLGDELLVQVVEYALLFPSVHALADATPFAEGLVETAASVALVCVRKRGFNINLVVMGGVTWVGFLSW